jgi:hypothetical protein
MAKSQRRRQSGRRDQVRGAEEQPSALWSDPIENVRNGLGPGSKKSRLQDSPRGRTPIARTVRAKAMERASEASRRLEHEHAGRGGLNR